jgi:hypothetical protein
MKTIASQILRELQDTLITASKAVQACKAGTAEYWCKVDEFRLHEQAYNSFAELIAKVQKGGNV